MRAAPRIAKAGRTQLGAPMSGIIPIVVFLVVMAALNLFEFGRLD
ncbi:MAG: hypothetical protein Q7T84_14195 [Phenylobacterium sp.]|nr:hypothetical protein [Phenylobacterium sp.]MDO9432446.1 hypothetical protein [Phenylobacterium sp.]